MNLGSTADLSSENIDDFIPIIKKFARIVTCEISQVPLSGVIRVLEAAKRSDCLTILDVDVSPSIAVHEAMLGTKEEILKAISLANVVKPAGKKARKIQICNLKKVTTYFSFNIGHVVNELLELYKHNTLLPVKNTQTIDLTKEISRELRGYTNSDLLAITNGSMPCILSTNILDEQVPTVKIDRVVDTTGAGDAFLGMNKYFVFNGVEIS